jgi:Tfp pilus assembly protein PilN
MPAKMVTVNLLEHDELTESPLGRIINWATTYGRYIMIATEIIVLLCFISRFSLDRKLNDLNEEIDQKKTIIEANASFEKDFRSLQQKLAQIKILISNQEKPLATLNTLKSIIPNDVYLENLTYSNDTLSFNATAGSNEGFMTFISNLQNTGKFLHVDIGDIKKIPLKGIVFQITVKIDKPAPVVKPVQTNDQTNTKL